MVTAKSVWAFLLCSSTVVIAGQSSKPCFLITKWFQATAWIRTWEEEAQIVLCLHICAITLSTFNWWPTSARNTSHIWMTCFSSTCRRCQNGSGNGSGAGNLTPNTSQLHLSCVWRQSCTRLTLLICRFNQFRPCQWLSTSKGLLHKRCL
jgi:hypothetical protein